MRSIFRFSDYREFLRASYEFRKSQPAGYSFERFSQEAGIKSRNYLKLVMDGSRSLSPAMIHQFAKGLKLSFAETQYFESLVLMEQAESDSERSYHQKKLESLRAGAHVGAARINQKTILGEWYYPAVLTAAHDCEISEASSKIQRFTGLSTKVIEQALIALEKAQFLKIENERYLMNDAYLYLRGSTALRLQRNNFLRQHLRLSNQAFEKLFDTPMANFFAHTFTIDESDYPKIIERIDQLLEELVKDSEKSKPNKTLQINLQSFCLEKSLFRETNL